MSPRSDEFFEAARRRLAGAEAVLDDDPSTALSAAYYAWSAPPDEALHAVELARSFLAAVEALFEPKRD